MESVIGLPPLTNLPQLGSPKEATETIADDDVSFVRISGNNGTEGPANRYLPRDPGSAGHCPHGADIRGPDRQHGEILGRLFADPGALKRALTPTITGTVVISAGSTTAVIAVNIVDDAIVEGNETVVVKLISKNDGDANVSIDPDAADDTATSVISDNDSATVYIVATDDFGARPAAMTDGSRCT